MKKYNLKKQKGFGVLAMIFTIVAIISAISFIALRSTDTTNLLSSSAINNTIVAQAGIIRSRILACGIEYPTGNNGTVYRTQYPAATTSINASTMTCPGANNANVWTLLDGLAYPNSVNGFGNWQYVNDATSLRISITTTTTDRNVLLPIIAGILGNQAVVSGGNTLTWTIVQ